MFVKMNNEYYYYLLLINLMSKELLISNIKNLFLTIIKGEIAVLLSYSNSF